MAKRPEFGDIEQLRGALRGGSLGQAGVVVGELVHEARDHAPQLGAVAATALIGASLGFNVAPAGAKTPARSDNETVVLKTGQSIWRDGLAWDQEHGGLVRPTVTEIEKLNHIKLSQTRDLAAGTRLIMAAPPTTVKLRPGGTIWAVAEDKVGLNRQKITAETAAMEKASGVTSEAQAADLPVGFPVVIPGKVQQEQHPATVLPVEKTSKTPPPAAEPPKSRVSNGTGGALYQPPIELPKKITSSIHAEPLPAAKPSPAVTVKPIPAAPQTVPKAVPISQAQPQPESTPPETPSETTTTPTPNPTPAPSPEVTHHKKHRHTKKKDVAQKVVAPIVVGMTRQPDSSTRTAVHHHKVHHKVRYITAAQQRRWECSPTSTHPLIGGDREFKLIHYLMMCDSDSLAAATGVAGNLDHEDVGLDPLRIENDAGETRDPATAGTSGWGIAQWTPGIKALEAADQLGIPDIYKFRRQVALVGAELEGTAPTGAQDVNATLKTMTDPEAAAQYFDKYFEAPKGGGNLLERQQLANQATQQYEHMHPPMPEHHKKHHAKHHHVPQTSAVATTPPPPNPPAASAETKPHRKKKHHEQHPVRKHRVAESLSSHTGPNAAIYFAALKYNGVSYSETLVAGHEGVRQWHQDFPIVGPNALLDCSGLVNLAVSTATGGQVDINDNTTTELTDTAHWQQIPFAEAQRGDLIQPDIGDPHVEIVNYVRGDMIYTFGAHTNTVAQPQQVGPAEYIYNSNDVFLRYVGPGAPLGSSIESPPSAPVPPPTVSQSTAQPTTSVPAITHHRHHHKRHRVTAPDSPPALLSQSASQPTIPVKVHHPRHRRYITHNPTHVTITPVGVGPQIQAKPEHHDLHHRQKV